MSDLEVVSETGEEVLMLDTERNESCSERESGDDIVDQFHVQRKCNAFPHRPGRALRLTWEVVEVTTIDSKRVLLQGITGTVKGRLLAIMGPTGAGKTTFMNMLAKRADGIQLSGGKIELAGQQYSRRTLKGVGGYVMQFDVFFPNLTVRETLTYAAQLRLPSTLSAEEKKERVEEVLDLMQLRGCQNLLVGDESNHAVSGSERKRLSVGVELMLHPRLLFLDEPTTGLDSATAYSLMSILRDLAHSGACTIVCTIHQPQTKIVDFFDDLLVLCDGKLVYHGAAKDITLHYADCGFPCDEGTNPADHIMDVITPLTCEHIAEVAANVERLRERHSKGAVSHSRSERASRGENADGRAPQSVPLHEEGSQRISWIAQLWILLKRSSLIAIRSWTTIVVKLVLTVMMAVLIGTVFLQLGDDVDSVKVRLAALFFCVLNQGVVSAMMIVNHYPAERAVVLRERAAGTYQVSAYFLSKVVTDVVFNLPFPIIFSCIVYWLIGFQADAGKFFLFMLLMMLCQMCGFAMASCVAAIGRTTNMSLIILPMMMEVWRLFGGFYVPPSQSPIYYVWLDHLDYLWYAYIGIAVNELTGLEFTCDVQPCDPATGEDVIESMEYDSLSLGGYIGVMIGFWIAFVIGNYIAIRLLK